MKIKSLLFTMVISIVLLGACTVPAPKNPTPTPTPMPSVASSPTPTLIPTPSTTPTPTPAATPGPTTPSLAPAALTLKSPLDGSQTSSLTPTLEWQPLAGDVSYGLQVATDQGFTNLIIDQKGIKGTSYVVPPSKLGNGKTYYWRVGAGNASGKSGWSSTWSFLISSGTTENILGVHTTKAVGEQKIIVIMVNFPDSTLSVSREQVYNEVFVNLDEYFRDASYGKMWLTGNVTGPYMMPHPTSDYNTSPIMLQVDPARVLSLVTDALNAADHDVNFSQYSYVMLILGEKYPGGYLMAVPGYAKTENVVTKSGQKTTNVSLFAEDSVKLFPNWFPHAFIEYLGGFRGPGNRMAPSLYDIDLVSTPGDFFGLQFYCIHMGFWDPLGCDSYYTTTPPMGMSSWTKLRLGWIEPSKIAMASLGQTTTVELDPLDSANSSIQVIKIPITSSTFYLIENRQKVGSNQYVLSNGILISYADDNYEGECRHGQGPVQLMDANPSVPYLQGAAFDVGKKEVFVDTQYNLAIILVQKVDLSYEIKITTADKANTASGNCVYPTFPAGFQRTK